MKFKSVLLGSAAAVALSTGAFAADPIANFVALDVCDAYNISGLTLASDDTCLKISGSVTYDFRYGDYFGLDHGGTYGDTGTLVNFPEEDGITDWRSRLEYNLKFEAVTATDAGAARAVIRLRERARTGLEGARATGVTSNVSGSHPIRAEEAYVAFGDTTVLSAGLKGSIGKFGSDVPLNYLGLYNSNDVDLGVDHKFGGNVRTGGIGISVVSEIADGVSAGIALENISRWVGNNVTADANAGTVVGFVETKGAWGDAHLTVAVDDALQGFGNAVWAFHAGTTVKLDNATVVAALAGNSNEYFNGLISASTQLDLFKLAASMEFASVGAGNPSNGTGVDLLGLGFGASAGFAVTDTVTLNLGGRYWDADSQSAVSSNTEIWRVALQAVAALNETLSVNGAIGYTGWGSNALATYTASPKQLTGFIPVTTTETGAVFGEIGAVYKPGGNFEAATSLEVNSLGAYRINFSGSKSF